MDLCPYPNDAEQGSERERQLRAAVLLEARCLVVADLALRQIRAAARDCRSNRLDALMLGRTVELVGRYGSGAQLERSRGEGYSARP